MKAVKVSIVIPAYNEEKYIGKCLDSLLKQTYNDIEIIVIDDGSKDRTLEILKGYEKKYKNIKILTQNHKGPGLARNFGAKNSKGEILIFVDADMEFDKDYVKILTEPILKGEAIGTSHRFEYIANLNNIWARCWSIKKIEESKDIKTGIIFRALKRSEFLKVGGFDPKVGFFDDGSIPKKINVPSIRTDAVCYHNNPSSLGEVFRQSKWIGGSLIVESDSISSRVRRFRYFILSGILLFLIISFIINPIYVLLILIMSLILYLTIKRVIKEGYLPYLFFLPIFYSVKFSGLIIGALSQTPGIINKKIRGKNGAYKY